MADDYLTDNYWPLYYWPQYYWPGLYFISAGARLQTAPRLRAQLYADSQRGEAKAADRPEIKAPSQS